MADHPRQRDKHGRFVHVAVEVQPGGEAREGVELPADGVERAVDLETGKVVRVTPARLTFKEELSLLGQMFDLSRWPTSWTVALSLLCGLLTVLNQTTIAGVGFNLPTAAQTAVTWGLAGFAFLGIGPTLGPKFAAAFKLPPKVTAIVSLLLLVGLTVAQEDVNLPYRAVIIGVVQIAGGLGFEPAYLPTV